VDDDAAIFRALADPTRREILDRLFERDGLTLGELERRFDMTRFGVMKHLRVLEEAGLVATRRVGREKLHYLNPVPIREIADRWIGKFAQGTTAALLALRTTLQDHAEDASKEGTAMEGNGQATPRHVYSIFIRTTPERLWEAITTSEFTLQYYYGSTVESEWAAGAPFAYSINGEPAIVGTVLEAEPPRRLVTTFDARWDGEVTPDEPSRITWEIGEGGPGVCQLTVVHEDFRPGSATAQQFEGGMPFILSGLKTLLETGGPLVPAAAAQAQASEANAPA
jgi:DNA-binding transcriptional ArsR family regulator/uncharacterized protein YndB with AHSA1/START domain